MNAKTILLLTLFATLAASAGLGAQNTGAFSVHATYSDGRAVQGFVEIFRKYDDKLIPVSKQPLVNGKIEIKLPAGEYNAIITTSAELEPQVKSRVGLNLAAGERQDWKPVFGQATVNFLAKDNKGGPVEACISVMFHAALDDRGNAVWQPLPRSVNTASGKATLLLAPGKYRISYVPKDIIGCPNLYEDMDLADKEVRRYEPTIEHGSLVVKAKDFRGPVPARITIYAARQGGRSPAPQYTCAFDGRPLTLRLQPARYSIDITADSKAIIPPTSQTFEPVKIDNATKKSISAYFKCARLKIDCEAFGSNRVRVELHGYSEETKGFAPFESLSLASGSVDVVLIAGKYRAIVVDEWVSPQQRYELREIDLVDGAMVERSCKIERGEICVVAALTKKASGTVSLFRKEGAVALCVTTWPLEDGEKVLRLPAGVYRLLTTVQVGSKLVDYEGEWRTLEDRARIMEALDLKSLTRSDMPLIDIWGPYELGDGDGALEVGEDLRVRVQITRATGTTTTVSVNPLEGSGSPTILGSISGNSEKDEFETRLTAPGRYALVVKTRNDHSGKETVVKKEFTVVGKR